jgi:hypothetical protein
MKINVSVLVLFLLLLLLAGALFASSLIGDAGYVWIVWQGWQVQTSVGLLLFAMLVLAIAIVLLLLLFGTLIVWPERRRQRVHAQDQAYYLTQLEQSSLYSVLTAPMQALACLQQPRQQAIPMIWPLLQAHQALAAGLPQVAEHALQQVDSQADELAMLLQIELALSEQQVDVAVPLLLFLRQTPADTCRERLEPAFTEQLDRLWLRWAEQHAWPALQSGIPTGLSHAQWQILLAALVAQLAQMTHSNELAVLYAYDQLTTAQQQQNALAWLQLLIRLPEGHGRGWLLVLDVLYQRFDPALLPLLLRLAHTFALPLGKDQQVSQMLQQLQDRYPGQPSIRLAQACWFDAQGLPDQADQWAQDWPTTELFLRLNVLRQLASDDRLLVHLSPALYDFKLIGAM